MVEGGCRVGVGSWCGLWSWWGGRGVGGGWAGCGFSRNIRNNLTICEQYSLPTPVIPIYHPPCPPFPYPTFPRPPLRVATPGCHQGRLSETPLRAEYSGRHSGSHFQANFRNSISWGPIGQGLISWWGPCPLEVPGRPKCGQGPRHRIRPCPSEPHGGAVLRVVKQRR